MEQDLLDGRMNRINAIQKDLKKDNVGGLFDKDQTPGVNFPICNPS